MKKLLIGLLFFSLPFSIDCMKKVKIMPSLGRVYGMLKTIEARAKNGEVAASVALYEFYKSVRDPKYVVNDAPARYLLLKFALLDAATSKVSQAIRDVEMQK